MKRDIARTATSVTVSELLMVMFVLPLLLHAWREKKHTCVSFFVIARCKMFCIDVTLLITMSSLATMITESVFAVMILSAKNKKKISFVLIAPRESFQDFGGLELPVTVCLAPVPRFFLVSPFRLSS